MREIDIDMLSAFMRETDIDIWSNHVQLIPAGVTNMHIFQLK